MPNSLILSKNYGENERKEGSVREIRNTNKNGWKDEG